MRKGEKLPPLTDGCATLRRVVEYGGKAAEPPPQGEVMTTTPKLTKPQREIVDALVNGTLLFNIEGRRKAVDNLVGMGFVRRILVDWCVGADKDGKPYKVYFRDNVTKAAYVELTAEGENMFK